jgi:3-deoxy-D-manno-octulosonic-acid transferase
MLQVAYGAAMYALVGLIRLAALWHPTARLWIDGRRGWRTSLTQLPKKQGKRIWFHVASLGEFEQARAVIEGLRRKRPDIDIVLTFFSPSGYEQRKKYPHARVCYLPADVPGNAARWIDGIAPDMAVFVKYDLWPGYVRALVERHIPALLIAAHWTPGQRMASWSNPLVRQWLKRFDRIFLQRGDQLEAFEKMGYHNLAVAGDTRIDRSLELPAESQVRLPGTLQDLGRLDLVAGSTWGPDEAILFEATRDRPGRYAIVPHDVGEPHIDRIMAMAPGECVRLSAYRPEMPFKYLVVDRIGLLAYLYALADAAYVGGGFGKGIHNTLEPMAYGIPVIVGPRHGRFPEAVDAIRLGGMFAVEDAPSLRRILDRLSDRSVRQQAGAIVREYLEAQSGASARLVDYIAESLPCPAP